jgi:hypothetical protein
LGEILGMTEAKEKGRGAMKRECRGHLLLWREI